MRAAGAAPAGRDQRPLEHAQLHPPRPAIFYGYPHFVADNRRARSARWSIPTIPPTRSDERSRRHCLMVWIEGPRSHTEALIPSLRPRPQPITTRPDFLAPLWQAWLDDQGVTADGADPERPSIRHAYRQPWATGHRLYARDARNWGVTVPPAPRWRRCANAQDAEAMVAAALGQGPPRAPNCNALTSRNTARHADQAPSVAARPSRSSSARRSRSWGQARRQANIRPLRIGPVEPDAARRIQTGDTVRAP